MANDTFPIPDGSAVPEPGELPLHLGRLNNLAGDDKLTADVLAFCKKHIEHHRGQDEREAYTKTLGIMDLADRMDRVSLRKDKTSAQYQATASNVASTVYHRGLRAINAGESSIFFSTEELPAVFEAEVNTTEYTQDDGRDMAQQANMLEEFIWDEDRRRQKLKGIFPLNNKYGNGIIGIEWERKVEFVTEKAPGYYNKEREPVDFPKNEDGTFKAPSPGEAFNASGQPLKAEDVLDADGRPRSFIMNEVKRVTKDWPTLSGVDMKNAYFDAKIPDLDDQTLFGMEMSYTYQTLMSWQMAGVTMNGKNITADGLRFEDLENDTLDDRHTNAKDDGSEGEFDGLFRVWNCYGTMPIKEFKGKRLGKGKWDPEKTMPVRYWATFVGNIMTGKAVCIRLIKNPWAHGLTGWKLIHSHRDDKGAYHDGYAPRIIPLYWQAVKVRNQAYDNGDLVNLAPWVADGLVKTKGLKFRANMIVKTAKNVKLQQLEVKNNTAMTTQLDALTERDVDKTLGADKPIQGEALGSRASATEAENVFSQAQLPLEDKASYLEDQVFHWMLKIDQSLMRQWADPDVVINVSHKGMIVGIKPTELWGPIKTKVVAVSRFKDTAATRRGLNSFIQNIYPIIREDMTPKGKALVNRQLWKIQRLQDADVIFPIRGEYDSRSRALEAANDIIDLGEWSEPNPDENQEVWLSVIKPMAAQYRFLPPEEKDDRTMEMLNMQIAIREGFMEQEQAQSNAQAQIGAAPGGEQSPQTPGQANGQEIAGQLGGAV